jgi:predicted CoA-binding protein
MLVTDQAMKEMLATAHRGAVVGLSNWLVRPSYGVADELQRQSCELIPVCPTLLGESVLGRRVYEAPGVLPKPPVLVGVCRRSLYVAEGSEQAIGCGAKALWTQLGIRDDAAVRRAETGSRRRAASRRRRSWP